MRTPGRAAIDVVLHRLGAAAALWLIAIAASASADAAADCAVDCFRLAQAPNSPNAPSGSVLSPPSAPPRSPVTPAAPSVPPLPDWYVAAMQTVNDAAAELERDRNALIAAWKEKAAGSSARISAANASTGLSADELKNAEPGAYEATGYDLPGTLGDVPDWLRHAAPTLGRYGRSDTRPLGGDSQWVQGSLDGLAVDLQRWRSCREGGQRAIADWFTAFETSQAAITMRNATKAREGKNGDQGDVESARLQDAADAADTISRGRVVAAKVARARLARIADCLNDHTFVFFDTHPIGVVARVEGERVPLTEGMTRLDAATSRLEEAELAWAKRAVDADTDAYAAIAEILATTADQIDTWRRYWTSALDMPSADLDRIEQLVDQITQEATDLEPDAGKLAAGSVRKRAAAAAERDNRKQANALSDQARALDGAHQLDAAKAMYDASDLLWAKVNAAQEEQSAIAQEAQPLLAEIDALRHRHSLAMPGPEYVIALVAEPSRELVVVMRREFGTGVTSANRGLEPGDPLPVRLALGVAFDIQPAYLGDTRGLGMTGTVEAGAGERPVAFARGSYQSWDEKMRSRIVLVSTAAEKILAAPPPAPPAPEAIEPRPARPRAPNEPESPIAGKWKVTYADGALGWVAGEAEVDPYAHSAKIALTHPKTKQVYTVVADDIRHEADGSYVMELRGQQPHLDARQGPSVEVGQGGNADLWRIATAYNGSLVATPPIPPALTRVPAADGATAVHVSFGKERATFQLPAAEAAAPAPLTLHLRPMNTKRGEEYLDAFRIIQLGPSGDDSLQGLWEQPVDPATRQPAGSTSRYRLLERDPANSNRAREVGVEIWWRPEAAQIELLAQTALGPIKVTRLFQGVPTVIEAVFDDPQLALTKEITVSLDGRDVKFFAKRDPRDYRRFATGVFLPAAPANSASGGKP